MSDNKYFTPEIEDIFVGYECETFQSNNWEVTEITKDYNLSFINEWINFKEVRTPYLTKEQIESEGWIQSKDNIDNKNIIFF